MRYAHAALGALLLLAALDSPADVPALTETCPVFVVTTPQGALRITSPGPATRAADAAPTAAPRPGTLRGSLDVYQYPPISLPGGGTLEVRVHVKGYEDVLHPAQKYAEFRYTGSAQPLRVDEIVLESIACGPGDGVALPDGVQSYPAHAGGNYYGIEWPVASTRAEEGKMLLAYRPGHVFAPETWHATHAAVAGYAGDFEDYILSQRPRSRGIHVNYNSWWTSPAPYYTERDILELMGVFRDNLSQPPAPGNWAWMDTFCIDMGWSNPKSLWEIDPKLFPDAFDNIDAAAAAIPCRLGLWISPSSRYPTALDNAWALENGYEGGKDYLCLGGPKYAGAFRERLVEMVTRYGIRHIKLDGYVFTCNDENHGHLPGPNSADAVAAGIIAMAEAVHAAAPETWLEPTGFGFNPSPWWLCHFNSVIGSFGDDAPKGRVPCPVYRESYTTGRDYYNLQGAHWNRTPQAGQEVLGVIHQTSEPFLNDAVMTVLRGHQFLPLYVNPKFMQPRDWQDLAALINWARDHAGTLARTAPILPLSWKDACPRIHDDKVPMPREPYGYSHLTPDGGLVVLRNPWIASATATVESPADGCNVFSLYPRTRVYGRNLARGARLDVPLAPYETLLLEFTHRAEPDTAASDTPAAGVWLSVENTAVQAQRFVYDDATPAFGPDYTSTVGDMNEGTLFTVRADVCARGAENTLLVLLEHPSRRPDGFVEIRIDGVAQTPGTADSLAGWTATGRPDPEFWRWVSVPLPKDAARQVELQIRTGDPETRASAWIWVQDDAARAGNGPATLPQPPLFSTASTALLTPTAAGSVTGEPQRDSRPVDKIDGIYLDCVEPVSATQGYGTLQKNQSVWEKPLVINGIRYLRGLGTHAPARIVYALDGNFRRFRATAGADSATNPTVTFEVWVDGVKKWESGLMTRGDAAREIDIDITGARELALVVGDGGNDIGADHADWADARLLR